MKPDDDDRDAIDVLYDIEDQLSQAVGNGGLSDTNIRVSADPGTKRHELLCYIHDHGPCSLSDVRHIGGDATTRALRTLYDAFALNRKASDGGEFEYWVSDMGEALIESEQQTLSDTTEVEPAPDPWEEADITESEYRAVEVVKEASGAPQSSDVNDEFVSRSNVSKESGKGAAITPYLTNMYRDGYIDRTPTRPYHYWVTDKGKDLLQDD
jgi:hypothetical protein